MKHYGLDIPEGSDITNITVPSGTSFPSNPNVGELFYLTSGTAGLYTHTGTEWVSAGSAEGFPTTVDIDSFTGDGTTTTFSLSKAPDNENDILVFVTGVRQQTDAYSLAASPATNLVFSEAPPNAATIEVVHLPTSITGKTLSQTSITATEGQTAFSASYNAGYVLVFLNGIRLVEDTDFTATDGSTITLTTGASAGDIMDVVSFSVFQLADHYTKTEAGTLLATYPRKNMLYNGDFKIWQRGTSFSASEFTADRWKSQSNGTPATVTIGSDNQLGRTLRYEVGTAVDYSIDTNKYMMLYQRLEIQDVRDFPFASNKSVTLSFYVKTNDPGTYTVVIQVSGTTEPNAGTLTYPAEFTVTQSGVFEKVEITIPSYGPTYTWSGVDTDAGLGIYFVLDVTPDRVVGGANTWLNPATEQRSAVMATNTNAFANSVGNYFEFAQVQLERGDSATDFEFRSIAEETNLCQRYYYRLDVAAGSGYATTSGQYARNYTTAVLPTEMRSTPTFTDNTVLTTTNATGGLLTTGGLSSKAAVLSVSTTTTGSTLWFIASGYAEFDAEL